MINWKGFIRSVSCIVFSLICVIIMSLVEHLYSSIEICMYADIIALVLTFVSFVVLLYNMTLENY